MNKQLTGFMNFIRTHGIVGLAVGLAIGIQAGKTVEAIVKGFINPIVGFILGSTEGLEASKWVIIAENHKGGRSLVIGWGSIVSSLITLVAVSAVIYFVVQGLKLDRLDKKKD